MVKKKKTWAKRELNNLVAITVVAWAVFGAIT